MRLYLFRTATIMGAIPVPAYLVRTDDGHSVLIDSGLPPELAAAAQQPGYAGMPIADFRPITAYLADLDVAPGDVDLLVATHLDTDHAGMHDAFPNAEIVIQRDHYAAAFTHGEPRYAGQRSHWDAPGLRYRQVDGDTELLPGITLIASSGHVTGHQAVLVRLPETGPVLLAIDAINTAGQSDGGPGGPFDQDADGVRASVRKLRGVMAREGVTLTVYGHDKAQWNELRLAPEYYV